MFFDSKEVPDDEFAVFPKGTVLDLVCIEAKLEPNSKGTGEIFTLTFQVLNSERRIFDRFNIKHQNPVAAKIGQQSLKKYCQAIGKEELKTSQDPVGCRCSAELGVKEYDGKDQNFVKKYMPIKKRSITTGVGEATTTPSEPAQSFQAPESVSLDDIPF